MSLATGGWGVLWVTALLARVAPGIAPSAGQAYAVAALFAVPGLVTACLCLRAGLAWVLLTFVPVFANGALLSLPWVLPDGAPWVPPVERPATPKS